MELSPVWAAIVLATCAGLSIPVGAALTRLNSSFIPLWIRGELRHGVIAFGAGALFAAVALVLIPEGSARLSPPVSLICFLAGGIGFAGLTLFIAKKGGKSAQFVAMMTDYLPEAMALGALVTGDLPTAVLVAVLIALQNLPEGFNAMSEMTEASGARVPLRLFLLMVPLGPMAAMIGLALPEHLDPLIGGVMMVASGGIIYLMFEDIAPQVPLTNTLLPPLGAILGFGVGLGGHLWI